MLPKKAAAEETNTVSPLNGSLLVMSSHSLIFLSNVTVCNICGAD